MKTFVAICLLCCAGWTSAAPQLGVNYDNTQRTIPANAPGTVEVIELFWYGCSHCYEMEPHLKSWIKTLPAGARFFRVPAVPTQHSSWAVAARVFYVMEMLGLQKALHPDLFDAIHTQQRLDPRNGVELIEWIANTSGVERSKVRAAYQSDWVQAKMQQAEQFFSAVGGSGVPVLVIDGKYMTSDLHTADDLIQRALITENRKH